MDACYGATRRRSLFAVCTVAFTLQDHGITFENLMFAWENIHCTPTTNYDRTILSGYSLGEYLRIRSFNGAQYALWGDARHTVQHPVNALDPLSGVTHTQQDVMFQKVKAQ